MDSLTQNFPEIKEFKEIHSSLNATIYEAIGQQKQEPIILKTSAQPSNALENEISIYKHIQKENDAEYSPKFLWTKELQDGTKVLALEALGPNMEMIYEFMNRRMPLKTLMKLGDLMINCVKELHTRGVIHCDIRPENFLIGKGKNCNDLYLIGFSKSKIVGENIVPDFGKRLERRASFQSLSSQISLTSCYRDDLESIGLVLIYFHEGQLPWQGILVEDDETRFDLIASIKSKTNPKYLCKKLPDRFETYFDMCWKLKENEIPDYNKFGEVFRQLLMLNNVQQNYIFDWPLTYSKNEQNTECDNTWEHEDFKSREGDQHKASNSTFMFEVGDNQNKNPALARTNSQILAEAILESSDDDYQYFNEKHE